MPSIKKKAAQKAHQPDKDFKSIIHHAADFYLERKQQFNIGVAVVIGILLIYGVYSLYQSSRENKAAQMLNAAYEFYSPTSGTSVDYAKALEGFKEVSAKYSNTMSGAMARLYAANALVNLGRPLDAIKEYESSVKNGSQVLRGLAYQRMGYVYDGLGRQEDAVKAFEQAEKLLGAGAATVELARFYEKSGNMGLANQKYKEITEKIPATTWAMEARTKLPPPVLTPPPASGQTGTAAK